MFQTSIKMREGIEEALIILMDKIETSKAFEIPVLKGKEIYKEKAKIL